MNSAKYLLAIVGTTRYSQEANIDSAWITDLGKLDKEDSGEIAFHAQ